MVYEYTSVIIVSACMHACVHGRCIYTSKIQMNVMHVHMYLQCYRKEDQVTKQHFREETTLDVYTVIYLNQYFAMSLNGKYYA
jgi:hypothetical protein